MRGYTQTVRFDEVRYRATKRGPCARCQKVHQRVRVFWQTLNPWNCAANGAPKTREQIMMELRHQAVNWQHDPIEPCRPRGRG